MNINKEISRLPPSFELLEFYRKKIEEHDKTKEELQNLLERYKSFVSSPEEKKEREILTKNVAELKNALSDLNVFIHAERQQVAKLQFQNEKLKAEQAYSEKKISFLLLLCNISEDQLNTYLRSSNKKEILQQICTRKNRKIFCDTLKALKVSQPSEIEVFLENKLHILNDNYEAATLSWHEEKNALLEERGLQKDEAKAGSDEDQAHINLLNAKLEESQRLLQEAIKKTIESKAEMIKSKNSWLAEKDKLSLDLKRLHALNPEVSKTISLDEFCSNLKNVKSSCNLKQMKKDLQTMKRELEETEELKDIFETRYRKLEEEMKILRDQKESQHILFTNRIKKIEETKELYKKQRDKTEERRKLQMEGFFSELKLVRNDLRKVVQQFFKLTSFYSENEKMPDVAEIKDLKLATTLARNIHHAIIKAKRNMITMESNYIKDELL